MWHWNSRLRQSEKRPHFEVAAVEPSWDQLRPKYQYWHYLPTKPAKENWPTFKAVHSCSSFLCCLDGQIYRVFVPIPNRWEQVYFNPNTQTLLWGTSKKKPVDGPYRALGVQTWMKRIIQSKLDNQLNPFFSRWSTWSWL